MNIYYTESPFAAFFRPFAAKCSAICCKMQCVLMQNAVRFAAKRKVKWCKMQCVLVQNASQNAAK